VLIYSSRNGDRSEPPGGKSPTGCLSMRKREPEGYDPVSARSKSRKFLLVLATETLLSSSEFSIPLLLTESAVQANCWEDMDFDSVPR
jgi:hypothetical protein